MAGWGQDKEPLPSSLLMSFGSGAAALHARQDHVQDAWGHPRASRHTLKPYNKEMLNVFRMLPGPPGHMKALASPAAG